MLTKAQAEGLLNALLDTHVCVGLDCTPRCLVLDLDPNLPADRELIAALSTIAA